MILGILFLCLDAATAQQVQSSPQNKTDPELQKLEIEVAKLKKDVGKWSLITGAVGLLAVSVSAVASIWVARRARYGAFDQSVHNKRLDSYPQLIKATAPLAVYFPSSCSPTLSVGRRKCREMGQVMSQWYFGGGGLLLSVEARDAYFRLATALTRASLAENLKVPVFFQDAEYISVEKLKEYRKKLAKKYKLDDVENWQFGDSDSETGIPSETGTPAYRFRDFVFLQQLSSKLRTRLSEDLRSRRRPS
jgi:hypothetical protein